MNDEIVASLVQEVRDLGDMGLYEFFWTLRGEFPEIPEEEYRDYSEAALKILLDTGTARLVWRRWDDITYKMDATGVPITEESWADPTEDPYLEVELLSKRELRKRAKEQRKSG